MNDILPENLFFIALAAGVTVLSLLSGSPVWYINFVLLLILAAILVITRTWHDRGFYLLCGGEPLVIACTIMNIWAGLYAVCMLAGIVSGAMGFLTRRQDIRPFLLFCASSFLLALLINASNHVLLPFLVICSITAIILGVLSFRTYQFRKYYAGGA